MDLKSELYIHVVKGSSVFEELASTVPQLAGSNFRFRTFQVSLILVVGAMNFLIRHFLE